MANSSWSDIELCEAARGGDREAEEIMLARYNPIVGRAARSARITSLDYGDLVSLAQEAILAAIRGFHPRHVSFGAFAKQCVHNRYASAVRAASRRISLTQHDREGAEGFDFDELIEDQRAQGWFGGVFTRATISEIRNVLSPIENRVLDKMLARGGVLDAPEDDERWADVATELGCYRTGVWRIVTEIRRKALGVLVA